MVTVVEIVQGPLSAMFSRAQRSGIDYVHAVTTGAGGETRTLTPFLAHGPQPCLSTIPAHPQYISAYL